MTETDIYHALGEIFADIFMRDDLVLTPELTANDVEGWTSFKMIEIIMATEEKFSIRLTTKEVDSLGSVGELASLISKKL